jgi:outer membrane receptor protein involved in Fe transport
MMRTVLGCKLFLLLIALIWLGFPNNLSAQAEAPTQVPLDTLVVTATRTEKKLEDVTASVSVVTREEIEQMPVKTVMDVMRNMKGVTVENDRGAYGSSTSNKIVIRGMGGDGQGRVMVLVDGMPAMAPGSNIFEWNSINLNTVERVEVVRGPSSALYGSSAMGGVINIITRRPGENGFETRLKSSYGRYKSWDENFYHSGAFDKFSYSISAGYSSSDGFNAVPLESRSAAKPVPGRNDKAEKVKNYTAALKLRYDFEDNADITFLVNYADYKRTGRYWFAPEYNLYSYSREGLGLGLHKNFGRIDSNLNLRLDFIDTNYDSGTVSKITGDAPNETWQLSVDQNNTFTWGQYQTITFGFAGLAANQERQYHYVDTPNRYRAKGGDQFNIAGFFQDEISLLDNKLMVVPGFRYDYWSTKGYDHDSNIALNNFSANVNKHLSPKIGLRLNPKDDLIIFRANYGEAFRVASLDDRFGGFASGTILYQSNNKLDPEISRTFDLGVDVNLSDSLSFSLTAYNTRAKNYIANVRTARIPGFSTVYTKQNIDKVRIKGFEASIQYRPNEYWTLFAEGNITDATIEGGVNDGNHIPLTPENKASLGFSFAHPDWFNLRVSGTRVGRIWQDQLENSRTVEGRVWLVDVRLSRRFEFGNWWAEPFVEATNLTNKSEVRFNDTSRMPINTVYGGLEIGF